MYSDDVMTAVPQQRETITPLEPPEPADLSYIRHAWGGSYRVTRDRGCWSARRLDGLGMFTAKSGEELLTKIRDDYAARPVARLMTCLCGWGAFWDCAPGAHEKKTGS